MAETGPMATAVLSTRNNKDGGLLHTTHGSPRASSAGETAARIWGHILNVKQGTAFYSRWKETESEPSVSTV